MTANATPLYPGAGYVTVLDSLTPIQYELRHGGERLMPRASEEEREPSCLLQPKPPAGPHSCSRS